MASKIQQSIFQMIIAERNRQDEKHGQLPRNFKPELWLTVLVEELGEVARAIKGKDGFNYEEELVQVCAVAMAALEDYALGQPLHSVEDRCGKIAYRNSDEETKKGIDRLKSLCYFLDWIGIQFITKSSKNDSAASVINSKNGLIISTADSSLMGMAKILNEISVLAVLPSHLRRYANTELFTSLRSPASYAWAYAAFNNALGHEFERDEKELEFFYPSIGRDAGIVHLESLGMTTKETYPDMIRWLAP